MDFDFILNDNYLAFFILNRKMFNESKKIENIKNKLYLENNLGYKKILEEEILDLSIYLKDENVKKVVDKFISTNKFNEIYKLYSNYSKEELAIKILKNFIKLNDSDLEKTKNDLWFKYKDGYYNLLNMNSFNPSIFLLDKDVTKTIQFFKTTDEFKKLYKETELYFLNVRSCWEANREKINSYLRNVLKIEFNIKPTVYISHPDTYKGYSFDNNKIAWGHYKGIEDSNYNLIYLVHEGLHCLLPFNKDDTEVSANVKHCIIELISDYELYSLLKGESTLNEGHSYLNEYKRIIYPYWLRYIGLDDYQRNQRLERDSVKLSDFNDVGNIDISNMNIQQFIEFCSEQYLINTNKSSDKKIIN